MTPPVQQGAELPLRQPLPKAAPQGAAAGDDRADPSGRNAARTGAKKSAKPGKPLKPGRRTKAKETQAKGASKRKRS